MESWLRPYRCRAQVDPGKRAEALTVNLLRWETDRDGAAAADTRYAKGPGGDIAYRVVGDGPGNVVIAPGWLSPVAMLSGDAGWKKFVEQLASFARVIQYDKRGTGLSDPVDGVPTLESRADDLRAVLDAPNANARRCTPSGSRN